MISEEVTLKILSFFSEKRNKGDSLEVYFYFKGKLTYLPQAIFFPSGCKVCTYWFGKR